MIINGDCLEIMRGMESNSIDTVITDPPYGLRFMGKRWDYSLPAVEVWEECLRVAKPGATLLCFGGSRTYHRMACAVEDAGWIIKDCILWIYGSGFPKALDLQKNMEKKDLKEAKQWDGWKSHSLKPAYEPIICAMKPNDKTYVDNALEWGVSGFNIEECRIGTGGRFPANIILDEEAGKMLDIQSGNRCGQLAPTTGKEPSASKVNAIYNDYSMVEGKSSKPKDNLGGASRFFYCAKASKSEKNAGVDSNNHPTCKPLKLMEYLCKLTKTPTGGIVLDPFAGSGSTGVACISTGREFIGIELDKDYCKIAEARIRNEEVK